MTTHDTLPFDFFLDESAALGTVWERLSSQLSDRWPDTAEGSTPVPAGNPSESALLREALTKAESVFVHSADVLMFFGVDGTIEWVSAASRQFIGLEPEELIGRNGFEMIHPDDQERVLVDFATIEHLGDSVRTEFRVLGPDGTVRWIEEIATNLLDQPEVGAIVGNLRDVTARKHAERATARLSAVVESSHDAILTLDPDGVVTSWNGGAQRLLGYEAHEIVGRDIGVLFPRSGRVPLRTIQDKLRAGERVLTDLLVQRSDGHQLQAEVSIAPLHDAAGTYVGSSTIARDVTARLELLQRIEEERQHLLEAQASARLGSFEFDPDGGWGNRSPELCRLLGTQERSFDEESLAATHPDDREQVRAFLSRVHRDEDECIHRIVRPDGAVRWVVTRRRAPEREHPLGPNVFVGTMLDITERHEAGLALSHQATHDALTGLLNRTALVAQVQRHLDSERPDGAQVALAFFDIDRFKRINDSHGHSIGDQLLEVVAARLVHGLRPGDLVGRFGGDEFLLARPGASSLEDARQLAEEAQAVLRSPVAIGGRAYELSASIGVTLSNSADSAESLLSDADTAMYQAKADGRDRCSVFDSAARVRARRRVRLQSELAHALERDELHLTYQPIVELDSGRVAGFEALLRWDHASLGAVSPEEFIPVAEATGLVVPIGSWVIEQAVTQLASWRARPGVSDDLWVAVNLSTPQLSHPELVPHVGATLRAHGVPAGLLHLEITESLVMDRVEHAVDTLAALRDLGASVSIDDFGTGYSSLSYLSRLPIDTLKVDRSFISDLGGEGCDASIVRAVAALGASLGLTVIAEGIENADQLELVRQLGCGLGQGYLWSRPLGASEALRWIDPVRRSEPLPGHLGSAVDVVDQQLRGERGPLLAQRREVCGAEDVRHDR